MYYLGIDVSKKTLDCCLLSDGFFYACKHPNTEKGFAALLVEISECVGKQQVHICCEATGIYYEAMAEYLHNAGYKISVENPRKIKGFGVAVLQRSKTDRQDAELIARYCKAVEPPFWQPQMPEQKQLRELIRYIVRLKKQRASEKVKLSEASEYIRPHIEDNIAYLDKSIKVLRVKLRKFYREHPEMDKTHKRLCTIAGIGEHSATLLQTALHKNHCFKTAGQFVAYLGLDPKQHQSGTSIRGKARISKVGNSELRTALYMPAIVAYNHNAFPRLVRNMTESGKKPMQIIVAIMRKLAVIAFTLIRDGCDFNKFKHC